MQLPSYSLNLNGLPSSNSVDKQLWNSLIVLGFKYWLL
jgi:hypothetical protein